MSHSIRFSGSHTTSLALGLGLEEPLAAFLIPRAQSGGFSAQPSQLEPALDGINEFLIPRGGSVITLLCCMEQDPGDLLWADNGLSKCKIVSGQGNCRLHSQ